MFTGMVFNDSIILAIATMITEFTLDHDIFLTVFKFAFFHLFFLVSFALGAESEVSLFQGLITLPTDNLLRSIMLFIKPKNGNSNLILWIHDIFIFYKYCLSFQIVYHVKLMLLICFLTFLFLFILVLD